MIRFFTFSIYTFFNRPDDLFNVSCVNLSYISLALVFMSKKRFVIRSSMRFALKPNFNSIGPNLILHSA